MSSLIRRIAILATAVLPCVAATLALVGGPAEASSAPPTATTGQASSITSSTAALAGSTYPSNQQTEYYFQYGPTAAYGSQTPPSLAGNGKETIHVLAAVADLAPYTTYYYRLVAYNATGVTVGAGRSFTTKKVPLVFKVAPPPRGLFGGRFSVSGTLAGTGSDDASVILQASPFPFLTGFKDVGVPGVTNAQGEFTLSAGVLTLNTELRVSTLARPAVRSAAVLARVGVRVALHVQSTGRPGFARFFGTVTPGQPGAVVLIQRLTAGGRPATTIGTLITSRNRLSSRFSRVVRISRRALYRADVQVVGGAQTSNHSRAVLVG